MDPFGKIQEIEGKYRLVLDLARRQLRCLETGHMEELPEVLHRKAVAVDEAGAIMAELRAQPDEAVRNAVHAELQNLAHLVEEVMCIEDRCQNFLPSSQPTTSKSRAASLYEKNR